jgi:hypothetical protein
MTPRSNMTSWLSSPPSCEAAECRSPAILSCILETKPSPDEFERIYQWTRAERRRLTSLASAHSATPADAGVAR